MTHHTHGVEGEGRCDDHIPARVDGLGGGGRQPVQLPPEAGGDSEVRRGVSTDHNRSQACLYLVSFNTVHSLLPGVESQLVASLEVEL